jgi:hypothetical protein
MVLCLDCVTEMETKLKIREFEEYERILIRNKTHISMSLKRP